jgi:hypothetical protein
MQSITPTQFFEEGRSFNIELACRAWGDTIIPIRFWAVSSFPHSADSGFKIFAKGEYPRGGKLAVEMPAEPYDKLWPAMRVLVEEVTNHMLFVDYPDSLNKVKEDESARSSSAAEGVILYFDSDPGLEKLQEAVGGYFTFQPTLDGRTMAMNEEGIIQGLPINEAASKLAGQKVRGPVAVFGSEE